MKIWQPSLWLLIDVRYLSLSQGVGVIPILFYMRDIRAYTMPPTTLGNVSESITRLYWSYTYN